MSKQRTIQNPSITFSGNGLHTGAKVEMTFKPAPVNFGIRFKRIDLEKQPEIAAIVENVCDTSRSTTIKANDAQVGQIEHVMSACYGMGVDNLLIEITAAETPIMDGSAYLFAKALKDAGIVEQEAERNYFEIDSNIEFKNDENGVNIIGLKDDKTSYNVMIDYNSEVLGNQFASISDFEKYFDEISKSKTFVFAKELEMLAKAGLIKGGDLDNALVVMEKAMTQQELDNLTNLLNKPQIAASKQGILNSEILVYPNEPARHKLLDLMGDLALVGQRIKGKIIASRPGHASNVEFAKLIKEQIKQRKANANKYFVDLSKPAVIDINRIKQMMPHRYPFLLVDRIIEMGENEIVGYKNLTFNEEFFQGHFPTEPVMPGVLQIEAMAQTGGILVLSQVEDPEKYSTYFVKIDGVKFKNKVVPGDTLVFKLRLTEPIRRGIVTMEGKSYVNGNLVCEAMLTAMVTKNK